MGFNRQVFQVAVIRAYDKSGIAVIQVSEDIQQEPVECIQHTNQLVLQSAVSQMISQEVFIQCKVMFLRESEQAPCRQFRRNYRNTVSQFFCPPGIINFGAMMSVRIINDGPVTVMVESPER